MVVSVIVIDGVVCVCSLWIDQATVVVQTRGSNVSIQRSNVCVFYQKTMIWKFSLRLQKTGIPP